MSKPSVVFSPEDHTRILELVAEGRTIRSIAEEFGHSLRSIQRYLNKQGIETAATKDREKNKQQKAETPPPKINERDRKIYLPVFEPPKEPLDPTPSEFKMRLITLEEKKQYDCSWIIGDPKKSYRYCGNSTIGIIGPYCEYHKGLSLTKQVHSAPRPYAPVNQK